MKNLMLVTAAFLISTLLIAHQMHSAPVPPPRYAHNPTTGACQEVSAVGCNPSGAVRCTVILDGVSALVYSPLTETRCALAVYKN